MQALEVGLLMSDKSTIEWCDASWNPIRAASGRHTCKKISPGCDHCYASTMTKRFTGSEYGPEGEILNSHPLLDEAALNLPVRWKKPRKIFVCSMTDLFGEWVPDSWLLEIFMTMAICQDHTFQVLTKRPKRMAEFMKFFYSPDNSHRLFAPELDPLPNVWLGVTIESDAYTWRADYLRDIDAAVRWISAEPLLDNVAATLDLSNIGWLVAGAESGHGARPCDLGWIRNLRDSCQVWGTSFFYKQTAFNGHKIPTPELDGKVWTDMPELAVPA